MERERVQRRPQAVEPETRDGVGVDDFGMSEKGSFEMATDFDPSCFADYGFDHRTLGEGDDPVRISQPLEHSQVLLGLRHPTVVGGNDEKASVDRADAREHVLDVPGVSRYIDEDQRSARRKRCPRESDVNRQAAAFLLRQSIWIDACQATNERGLAMVDVPGSR